MCLNRNHKHWLLGLKIQLPYWEGLIYFSRKKIKVLPKFLHFVQPAERDGRISSEDASMHDLNLSPRQTAQSTTQEIYYIIYWMQAEHEKNFVQTKSRYVHNILFRKTFISLIPNNERRQTSNDTNRSSLAQQDGCT